MLWSILLVSTQKVHCERVILTMFLVSARHYAFFSRVTLVAVFLLVLVGGLVRSTESGMGCPDWPKCFGRWVPPTHESQLPSDYHVRYATHGYVVASFDAVKTWTEYLNRLLGVTIGFLILLTFISALAFWRSRRSIVVWQGAAVLIVGLQGWLGAKVVFSNLHPLMVTLHMALTLLLIISLLTPLYATRTMKRSVTMPGGYYPLILFGLFLVMIQILLGIQVREQVDVLLAAKLCRCCWLSHLGPVLTLHRAFSWGLLLFTLFALWVMRHVRHVRRLLLGWSGLLGLEVILGFTLIYADFPFWAEPLHLLIAFMIFAILWQLLLIFRPTK